MSVCPKLQNTTKSKEHLNKGNLNRDSAHVSEDYNIKCYFFSNWSIIQCDPKKGLPWWLSGKNLPEMQKT